jgi:hypothetical protein
VGCLNILLLLSRVVIVLGTSDIVVREGRGTRCGRLGQGLLIELGFENGFDAFIGAGADRESAATSGFETLGAVAFAQTHDAQARPEALLRMGS